MVRKVLIAVVAAGALAAPAFGYSTTLMPGVTYTRQVIFTPHGPVGVHVIVAPRPGGLYALKPAHSNGEIVGRERLTGMEKDVSSGATVAGINGDYPTAWEGPSGVLIEGGTLESLPYPQRSSIGIGSNGSLDVRRIAFSAFWQGLGQRRPLNWLNAPATPGGITIFTRAWGPQTPANPGAIEDVVVPFPTVVSNTDLAGTVIAQYRNGGGTAIPPGGAVFSARGGSAQKLAVEAPVGARIVARFELKPDWGGIANAIGGGPVLVQKGRPVFRAFEAFTPAQLAPRLARSAVCQRKDGSIVLVAVDGEQPGYSVGLTNFELATELVRLHCITGSGLEPGGATTMAFDGTVLNQPSNPAGEQPVSEALLVDYYGVYVPPPAVAVLSPNGDGANESQTLGYKVVRPSSVSAVLVGPRGAAALTDSGQKPPGRYTFPWAGTGAPEGKYTWRVTATDDLGRQSTATQTFLLDDTLGFLQVAPTQTLRSGHRFLLASFKLTRAAKVTVRIESRTSLPLLTVLQKQLQPGDQRVVWNGRDRRGRLFYRGRYVVSVTAANGVGTDELTAALSLRRG
ncbi:MAG: phosphodiester glycosidase family protein [Gaiellaceae bacterium]